MNNLVFEMTGPVTANCSQTGCEATGPVTANCSQTGCEETGPVTANCSQTGCEATGPTANCSQTGCEATGPVTANCSQTGCGSDVASSTQQYTKVAVGNTQVAPPQYQYTQQSFQPAPAFLC